METQTTACRNQIADRGNQNAIVDRQPVDRGHQLSSRDCLTLGQATKTADCGHQLSSRDCLTLGQATKTADCGHQLSSRDCLTRGRADQNRPTVNHTVRADKKLTNLATKTEQLKTPTQYAHNCKPHLPTHKPKLAIESAATAPNCPDDQPDSTSDEIWHRLIE
jgi:hypothetical protein